MRVVLIFLSSSPFESHNKCNYSSNNFTLISVWILICFLESRPKLDTSRRIYSEDFISIPPQIFCDLGSERFKYHCVTALIRKSYPCLLDLCHMVPCLCASVCTHTHAKMPDHHCISLQAQPPALKRISKACIYSYLCLAAPRK